MYKKHKSVKFLLILLTAGCLTFFSACTSWPKKTALEPVKDFDLEQYLGDWYEIARFDFLWEKDLKNVMANYSLNENGSIKVTNTGYNYKQNNFKESIGKAKVKTSRPTSELKVSFFGPFYSDYTIIAVDNNYQYALVAGKNLNYLWFLSRTPQMPEEIRKEYISIAEGYGYNLSSLVWTVQESY